MKFSYIFLLIGILSILLSILLIPRYYKIKISLQDTNPVGLGFGLILIVLSFYIPDTLTISFKDIYQVFITKDSSTETKKFVTKDSSKETKKDCSGVGNESCIDNVRERFSTTGKTILNEKYLGGGVFGIDFLDINRGVNASARVSTDCNCEVIDVSVSNVN